MKSGASKADDLEPRQEGERDAGVRQQARDAARQAILEAARELFAEKGFAATSVVAIAARAGFAKGLVHHYFGSKRELWREVIDRYGRDGTQREVSPGGETPDIDDILSRMRRSFRFFQQNREYLRIASWAELESEKGLPPSIEKLMHQHTDELRRAQLAGAVRGDLDPAHLHAMTYCLMTGWFHTKRFFCPAWDRDPEAAEVDDKFLEDMLTFVRGGMSAIAQEKVANGKRKGRK